MHSHDVNVTIEVTFKGKSGRTFTPMTLQNHNFGGGVGNSHQPARWRPGGGGGTSVIEGDRDVPLDRV